MNKLYTFIIYQFFQSSIFSIQTFRTNSIYAHTVIVIASTIIATLPIIIIIIYLLVDYLTKCWANGFEKDFSKIFRRKTKTNFWGGPNAFLYKIKLTGPLHLTNCKWPSSDKCTQLSVTLIHISFHTLYSFFQFWTKSGRPVLKANEKGGWESFLN